MLISTTSLAQIGIKGGIGVSDILFMEEGQTPYLGYEINSLEHRKPLLTYQAGVFTILELGKRFEFQPELIFATNGLNYSTTYLYDDICYKIKINYLKLPLLFRYKFIIKEKRNSGFILGPYAALKLKATKNTEFEGAREDYDLMKVNDFDFGLILTYSMNLNLPKGKLLIDLRCSYGLINMMERVDGYIPYYYGPEKEYARNFDMTLSVGYFITNLRKGK